MRQEIAIDRADLASFYETARFFNSTSDTEQISAHIHRTLMGRLAITRAILALGKGDDLRVTRSRGARLPPAGARFLVKEHCRTLRLPNRFELLAPSGEPLGVLALGLSHNGSLATTQGRAYLDAVLDMAASTLSRVRIDRHRLDASQEMLRGLRAENDPGEIARLLGLTVRGLLGTPTATVVAWKLGRGQVIWPSGTEIDLDAWDLGAFATLREITAVGAWEDEAACQDLQRSNLEYLVPLRTEGTALGFLALGEAPDGRQWPHDQLALVSELTMQAAAALVHAWSKASISLAAEVQRQLLPSKPLPSAAGFDIDAFLSPALVLSGDWYDLVVAGEDSPHPGRIRLCFADISGKGPNAALAACYLAGLIRPQLERFERSLQDVLKKANERMHADLGGSPHATVFAVEMDAKSHTCRYASAGHDPALIIRQDGSVEELGATARTLGHFPGLDFSEQRFVLEPGDLLAIYSDGITEAERGGEELGRDRLAQYLVAARSRPAEAVRQAVLGAVEDFAGKGPQQDDITLLIIKRTESA